MTQATPRAGRWTLDPNVDVVFTLLSGAEQNQGLLISFLNDVLRPPSRIATVTLLAPRPETVYVEDKYVFLDLRVRLQNGAHIDVEKQDPPPPCLLATAAVLLGIGVHGRAAAWRRLLEAQTLRRDPDCRFCRAHQPRSHSILQVRDSACAAPLCDHLEIHVLELPKLQNLRAGHDEPALAAWCRFLSAQTDTELEALAVQHPILKDAKDALAALSSDPVARERAERRDSELKLYEYGLSLIRDEGRSSVKRQTLERQLTRKFGTLESATAARLSSASEDDLDRWLDHVISAETLDALFDAE